MIELIIGFVIGFGLGFIIGRFKYKPKHSGDLYVYHDNSNEMPELYLNLSEEPSTVSMYDYVSFRVKNSQK